LALIIVLDLMILAGVQVDSSGEVLDPDDLMAMSLDDLLNIRIITASKVPEPRSKSTSNVYVLTASELKRLGVRTYHEALQMIPGFSVYLNTFGERVITLRGVYVADSPGVLILLNGHVLNGAREGTAVGQFLDEIPIEIIERIEVIRGPGSALYGANAFLGVINIITKKADDMGGLELRLNTEFESGNDIGQTYNLQYGKRFENDMGLSLNVNWLNHDGPELWASPDYFGRSGHASTGREQFDLQATLELGEFELHSRYFHRSADAFFGVLNVLEEGSDLDTDGMHVEAEWTHSLNANLELKARAYLDHIIFDNYYVGFPPGTAPAGSPFVAWNGTGLLGNPSIDETHFGGELQFTYEGRDSHILVGGIAYRYESQHDAQNYANRNPLPLPEVVNVSDVFNWIKNAHRSIYSVYVQDIWDLHDALRLTTGVRFDEFSDFGSTVNPRIGLSWRISDRFDTKLSYGKAFRAPSFNAQFLRSNPVSKSNPDLNAEEVQTFEASLAYKHGNRFLGSLTYYHTEIDDLIQVVPGINMYENAGKVDIDGLELELRLMFNRGGYLRGYYTVNSSSIDSGDNSANVPASTTGYELNLPIGEKLNWNVNAYWQSETEREMGDARDNVNDYGVLNTTLLVQNFWKGLELRFSVLNVLDNDYVYPAPRNTYVNDYPAPGRSFVVGATWRF
jgi:iron complex outermembrane receptor protein